jgi:hypothetical protein
MSNDTLPDLPALPVGHVYPQGDQHAVVRYTPAEMRAYAAEAVTAALASEANPWRSAMLDEAAAQGLGMPEAGVSPRQIMDGVVERVRIEAVAAERARAVQAVPDEPAVAKFARLLPDNIPAPELCLDPDGDASLDWCVERDIVVSVSVGAARYAFASRVGGEASSGEARIDDGMAEPLRLAFQHLAQRVSERGTAAPASPPAEPQPPGTEHDLRTRTLAQLVGQLVSNLKRHDPGNVWAQRASEYLGKHRLLSPLRDEDSPPADAQAEARDAIRDLIAEHARLLETNHYAYFELGYTRQTEWMAWLCDRPATGTPGEPGYGANRKVLAQGQGFTPEEACADALTAMQAERGREGDRHG